MSKNKTKSVYNPKLFTLTGVLSVDEYFKEFQDLVAADLKTYDHLQNDKNLATVCNPDTLTVHGEIPVETNQKNMSMAATFPMSYNIDDTDLKILECKKKWLDKCGEVQPLPCYEKQIFEKMNMDLKPFQEVLLTVKVYKSLKLKYTKKCVYEIAILARQTLLDLRNKMLCSSDMGFCKEIQTPDEIQPGNVKETYPSGFLFIEDCFYNLTNHRNAVDYSQVIRDWAGKCNMGPFTTASMEKTVIRDLKIVLGAPYLYQHQGNCEHVFVFSDARLLCGKDPLLSTIFPYVLTENKKYTKFCYMCLKLPATFVVTDCDRLPHAHNFFCKNCLVSYNYTKDGSKIGRFKLFPFYNQSLQSEHY